MTFLPIVSRELHVACRKRSTFWLRTGSALIGLIIGGAFMLLGLLAGRGAPNPGDALFHTLTVLAAAAVLCAGLFLTSDCLSEEKREGTLGFLFLTDLRGYDVVGGKLMGTSLRCAYGLLAIFPILAVSTLAGAVTGLQLLETFLALFNALFFSLAAGLMVSAISRDSQRALAATLLLLLVLVGGGPLADEAYAAAHRATFAPLCRLTSPAYAFAAGAWGRSSYWLALAVSHGIGWLLLAVASIAIPYSWQQKSQRPKALRWGYWWKYGGTRRRVRLRRKLLDLNPVLWLTCRERWQALGVWLWLVVLIIGSLLAGLLAAENSPQVWMFWSGTSSALMVFLLYLWTASQACRFFLEGRRSGLLELVLSTSLSAANVVEGQWRGMLRSFGPPAACLILVQLANSVLATRINWGPAVPAGAFMGRSVWLALAIGTAGVVNVTAGLAALIWFGMWMGLNSKNVSLATLKTFLFVKVIPAFVVNFLAGILSIAFLLPRFMKTSVTSKPGSTSIAVIATAVVWPLVMGWVSALLSLAIDLGLIYWSRARLCASLRALAARDLRPVWLQPPPPLPPPIPQPPAAAPAPPVMASRS